MRVAIVFVDNDQHAIVPNAELAELLGQVVVEVRVVEEAGVVADAEFAAVAEFRLEDVFDEVVERGAGGVDVDACAGDAADAAVGVGVAERLGVDDAGCRAF